MPSIEVVFYQESENSSDVFEWLRDLSGRNAKAYAKCVVRIERLAELGHELKRPECDYLGNDIYELRAKQGTVNYRLLYFFHGQLAAVIAWGLTKEDEVPITDIHAAVKRMNAFRKDPEAHTLRLTSDEAD